MQWASKNNILVNQDYEYSDMIAEYKESYQFSYGFSNSAPGEGHMNKTGHRIVAETVYEFINEMEAQK